MKDSDAALVETTNSSGRGGRGRGALEGTRGGRGRASDRPRGANRGGRGGSGVNGTRTSNLDKGKVDTAPTPVEPSVWDVPAPKTGGVEGTWDQPTETDNANMEGSWENIVAESSPPRATEASKASSKPDGTRSWASIFNKPAPAPVPLKASQAPSMQDIPVETLPSSVEAPTEMDMPGLPPPILLEDPIVEIPNTPPMPDLPPSEPAPDITPTKDELTETNLVQILDVSIPPATATAASTVASTHDARAEGGNATPIHVPHSQATSRPPMGGYATSAFKATGMPGRSASFQRRVLEQQEAVVMPGNHAVDRAVVQFGSMGLNGTTDDLDLDDDREEPETRTQPPQHSPVAPRATLPPAPQQQAFPVQPPSNEVHQAPRQAPGLPLLDPQLSQTSLTEQGVSQQPSQVSYSYNQLNNRYGPQASQQEPSAPAQKAYEPFGQQIQQPHHQYDGYPTHSQAPAQSQNHAQSQIGGYSSASNDNTSYYTSDSQRNAYQNYYGNYGHQQPTPQEAGASQQRIGSGFGTSVAEQASQYATSQSQQQPPSRYAQASEAQTSGHSTPNPLVPGQQSNQTHQGQHMPQQQTQGQTGGQHGPYPYGHPYYNANPYYSYMNQVSHQNHSYGRDRPMFDDVRRYDDQYLTHNPQFGYGGNQAGYGGGPFGGATTKQGMYGQPHQGYGMSPQTSYDQHSSSPANVGSFGQQHSAPSREGTATGGLGGYGRSGSTQPSEPQQQHSTSGAGAFGSMPDVFARSQSGYPGQTQGLTHQQSNQQAGNEESLRGYGDSSKVAGGPSPALGQPGARPGSAANMQAQTGLPPPQSQSQQGYTGFPGHVNHQMHGQQGSQYGAGLGGMAGHHQSGAQAHQGSGYGGYGVAGSFGGSYYGGNNRGGWSGGYGGH